MIEAKTISAFLAVNEELLVPVDEDVCTVVGVVRDEVASSVAELHNVPIISDGWSFQGTHARIGRCTSGGLRNDLYVAVRERFNAELHTNEPVPGDR